jgi:hypothetical protein
MMLILQVVRLIGIFSVGISLTLTKIKLKILKDQGQGSEFLRTTILQCILNEEDLYNVHKNTF